MDLGTVGQTITSVEWRMTANQDGWYFIEHPLGNKRLKDNGNGTFNMVAITTTDAVKGRVIVPFSPEAAEPPYAFSAVFLTSSFR